MDFHGHWASAILSKGFQRRGLRLTRMRFVRLTGETLGFTNHGQESSWSYPPLVKHEPDGVKLLGRTRSAYQA